MERWPLKLCRILKKFNIILSQILEVVLFQYSFSKVEVEHLHRFILVTRDGVLL